MKAAEDGSVQRPARSGEKPSTSWRYCGMKRNTPYMTRKASVFTTSEALNAGARKRPRSIRGSASRRCRRTNTTPSASPAAMASAGTADGPCSAMRLIPKITASTAQIESPALARSNRPGSVTLNSGSSSGPSRSSSTIAGTASRNTEPHQKCCSSIPPRSGPRMPPIEKLVVQMPIATVRWRGSWNMLRIRERVDGIRVAPATPSTARAAISIAAVVENAASTEATPNALAPISRSRRRPMRSPSVPMVMSEPAIRKP